MGDAKDCGSANGNGKKNPLFAALLGLICATLLGVLMGTYNPLAARVQDHEERLRSVASGMGEMQGLLKVQAVEMRQVSRDLEEIKALLKK